MFHTQRFPKTAIFILVSLLFLICSACQYNQNLDSETTFESNPIMPIDQPILEVPWSLFYMHVESIEAFDKCFAENIQTAEKYNTPLTLMLWPQVAEHILEDKGRVAMLRKWMAHGHEVGIHAQGCMDVGDCTYEGACLRTGDAEMYTALIGANNLKTAHVTPCIFALDGYRCTEMLPDSVKYFMRGRFDGRNAVSIGYEIDGRTLYALNGKAGYGDAQGRMAQYLTMSADEVFVAGNHAECDIQLLEEWLKFLYKKDAEGSKRTTQTWIMENVMIPEVRTLLESEMDSGEKTQYSFCSQLIGEKVFTDAWGHHPTDIFNFGRCVRSGTFCLSDQICGKNGFYVPMSCKSTGKEGLDIYQPASEICPVACGDGACSHGENQVTSGNYCPADCLKKN